MSNRMYRREPSIAKVYRFYKNRVGNHRGKARVLRWMRAQLSRLPHAFEFELANGVRVLIQPAELEQIGSVGSTCFEAGSWEGHVESCLQRLLSPGDVAFDIGANIGYDTAIMAKAVASSGVIFSFEPVPHTYELLKACISLNKLSNVSPQKVGLGEQVGAATIRYSADNSGIASLHTPQVGVEKECEISITTVDRFCRDNNLQRLDLLKIDVEGHELAVIKGAATAINTFHPVIIFEFNPSLVELANWSLVDMARELDVPRQYVLYELASSATPQRIDCSSWKGPVHQFTDVLALPTSRRPD